MSSVNEHNLTFYKMTLANFEILQTICSQNIKNYKAMLEHLRSCLIHINFILVSESDQLLSEGVLQLKNQILKQIENITLKNNNQCQSPKISATLTSDIHICKTNHSKKFSETSDEELGKRKQPDETPDKKLMQTISNFEEVPTVQSLNQVVGLHEVKKILKSMIILPQTQPQIFVQKLYCNTVLLYGPPGTGKTHIVHALASEAKAKLFTMSGANVLSSYVGQTEEKIHTIFKYIKSVEGTSILFIDEIDGLCRKRSSNEQEYSRRIKTELMNQLSRIEDCMNAYVICATNCPWDLDTAILRRFQRRVYVPLPNQAERLEFFNIFMKGTPFEESAEIWTTVAEHTEGYSGSDLACIVKHALSNPIMELEDTKMWKFCVDGFYEPMSSVDDVENIICRDMDNLPPHSVRTRPLEINDILYGINNVAATVSRDDILKYELFKTKF